MKLTNNSPRVLVGSLIVAGGLSVVLLGGCALRSDADASPPTPGHTDGDVPVLIDDGKHLGAIPGAYVGPPELTFDAVEFFVGDDADREARIDGVDPADIGDFYIRDSDDETVSLPVADDVIVTVVDCSDGGCEEGVASDYDSFTSDRDESGRFWITVDDGVVVRIDQQYLP